MNRDSVTSSRYSPGNLPGELLERLFVARGALLNDVLGRIDLALTKGSQYFQLLVGPRGAGKTHLIALLRHRVATDPRFVERKARLCLAPLNEEEWGVASYLDLLVRILRAIANHEADASLQAAIDDLYQRHARAPESSVAHAETLLAKHVGDRTLVVLCENLDEILRGLGSEGQKRWRASMQQRRFWNVVATTSALSDALRDHNSPFFNFFHLRALDRLDLDAATALMRRKAEVDGKHDLAALLDTRFGRARMRAVHHLAGGNSRVYVILSDFLTKDSLDSLWPAFVRTVDDLTPYYQDRIRQLAPAQRKIVECLCQAVHAIRVKDIATRCLMSQQTAAKQLSELARIGYVDGKSYGRETYYELTEPLLRICIDVKDNRTRHLRTFVELMRHWFSVGEMQDRLLWLDGDLGNRRPMDRLHLQVALEESQREGSSPHLDHLSAEATTCTRYGDHRGALELHTKLVKERGWPSDYSNLANSQRALGDRVQSEQTLRQSVKRHSADVWVRTSLAEFLARERRVDEALEALELPTRSTVDRLLLDEARSRVLRGAGRVDEAARIDERILKRCRKGYVLQRAEALGRLERRDEAIALLDAEIARDPENVLFVEIRGWHLLEARRFDELLQNEDLLTTLAPADELSEYRRSRALLALARADEAIEVLKRRVALDPRVATAHRYLAEALLLCNRFAEAIESAREAHRLDPSDSTNALYAAEMLVLNGDPRRALQLCDAAQSSGDTTEWDLLRARALVDLGRYLEAMRVVAGHVEGSAEASSLALLLDGIAGAPDFAVERIRDHLEALPSDAARTRWLGRLCVGVVRTEGPAALVRRLVKLRGALPADLQRWIPPGVLMALILLGHSREPLVEAWDATLPEVLAALDGLPGHELIVPVLSAFVRYLRSGDPVVLLELPREVRGLLETVIPAQLAPAAGAGDEDKLTRRGRRSR